MFVLSEDQRNDIGHILRGYHWGCDWSPAEAQGGTLDSKRGEIWKSWNSFRRALGNTFLCEMWIIDSF